MMMETISPLIASQKPPVTFAQPVVVVCDVADYHALMAVSSYLQTTGLLDEGANVQVMAPAVFANERVQQLLADDRATGKVGFVVVKDHSCRHYFKGAEQPEFSIHITRLP